MPRYTLTENPPPPFNKNSSISKTNSGVVFNNPNGVTKVTENPSPYKHGDSTVTTFDSSSSSFISQEIIKNKLVDSPKYIIVQTLPTKPPPTIINTTNINNTTVINAGDGVKVSAEYFNTITQNNISSRTLLSNNGGGAATYDDNSSPIWNTASMRLQPSILKEVFDVSLRFTVDTNTLGGTFEVEAFSNVKIDIIEEEVNIQEQDFTIRFKLVTDQRAIDNGICFFITPELGMTLSVKDYSLLIVKG